MSTRHKKRISYLLFIIFTCVFFYGCSSIKFGLLPAHITIRNCKSESKAYCDNQQTYMLLVDCFVAKEKTKIWDRSELVIGLPEGIFNPLAWNSYPSINDWQALPGKYANILGIIEKGTKIQHVGYHEFYSINWWYGMQNWLIPYAKILDGPYRSLIVNIRDLRGYNKEKRKYTYSKKLLLLSEEE